MDYEERLICVPGLGAGIPMPTILWLTRDTGQQLPSRISDPDKRSVEGRIASWLKIVGARNWRGSYKRRIVQIARSQSEVAPDGGQKPYCIYCARKSSRPFS